MAASKSGSDAGPASLLRQIPAVDELLGRETLRALEKRVGHGLLVDAARNAIQNLRARISGGTVFEISVESLENEIAAAAESFAQYSLRPVINASGVILHTNLGRAPLAARAVERLAQTAGVYSNLEYNLELGERGKRDEHTDRLFARLLGAEMTLVVNNNAAAVFLALNTLAEGGEVIVSRGELIEIGGAFRIPDICSKSGATLREVGTTNRTRLGDYASAINEGTRAILRVHPSNFRMVGFTERPALVELVKLAHDRQLPLVEDLGSGSLFDLTNLAILDEPTVGPSLKAGVDVVTFSGDKLLGGPQAGILVGSRGPLQRIRRNPLFRALRVDKLTITALEATVALYVRGEFDQIPVLRMIRTAPEELAHRANQLAEKIANIPGIKVEIRPGESVVGGGSTPGQSLATSLVSVSHHRLSSQALESELRRNDPPIIARIEHDQLVLDLRTVLEGQEEKIVEALRRMAASFRDAAAGKAAQS